MYGKAFEILFKSFRGNWRIELSQKDYTGSVTQLAGGADVANFALNNQGDAKHKPLKSFMAQLQIEVASHGQLASIFGSDAQKTRCRAYLNDALYFSGYVSPDDYSEPLLHTPYDIELQAICGLGLLQEIDFLQTDGSWYVGRMNKLEIIRLILEKIDSHELPMYIASGMYESRMTRDTNALVQQYVNVETYVSSDGDPLNCYDVLSDLLLGYRFLQQDGAWHATQLNLLDGTPYLADHYEMQTGQYTRQGSILVNPKVELFDKAQTKYNGYVKGSQGEKYIEGAKQLTCTQELNIIDSLFKTSDWGQDSWEKVYINPEGHRAYWDYRLKNWQYVNVNTFKSVVNDKTYVIIDGEQDGYIQTSFPIKVETECNFRIVFNNSILHKNLSRRTIGSSTGTSSSGVWTPYLGTTGTLKISIKLGDKFMTKDGWVTSSEYKYIEQEITSSGIEQAFELTMVMGEIPSSGNLEIRIYIIDDDKVVVLHNIRAYFLNTDDTELCSSKELVGVQNPLKANVLDDLTLLTGDVPELSNFDSVWYGGLTLAGNLQTKNWQALGHDSEYDYAELISRIALGGYSSDIHTLSATMEAEINALSIIYDKYTGRCYAANGITYNVEEDEWSGEWIEVMPYAYAGANFNASQVSSSREGNYTKTSQTNNYAVYGNGEMGTGKRVYELPLATDLEGVKILVDNASWPEARYLTPDQLKQDLSTYALKTELHSHSNKDLLDTLSVVGNYLKVGDEKIDAGNADMLGNIEAANYWNKTELINDALYLKLGADKIKAGYADLAYDSDRLGKVAASNYWQKTELINDALYLKLGADKIKAGYADLAYDSDRLGKILAADYWNKNNSNIATRDWTMNNAIVYGDITTSGFAPGIVGGVGAKIDQAGHGEMKSLDLREFLRTPELIKNQVRVAGNQFWFTDPGLIQDVTGTGPYTLTLKIEEGDSVSFRVDDILIGIFNHTTGFETCYLDVISVDFDNDKIVVNSRNGIAPRPFMQLARKGNETNADRQTSVFVDGLEGYLRVLGDVDSHTTDFNNIVAQMGYLNLTSPVFGLMKRGVYVKDNGYFENVKVSGEITVTGGNAETKDGATTKAGAAQTAATSVANAAQNTADTANALVATKTDEWVTRITQDTITAQFIKTLDLTVGDHIQMGANAVISWDKVSGTSGIALSEQQSSKTAFAKDFIFQESNGSKYIDDAECYGGKAFKAWAGWTGRIYLNKYFSNVKIGGKYKVYARCKYLGTLGKNGIMLGIYNEVSMNKSFNITGKISNEYQLIELGEFTADWQQDLNTYLWILNAASFSPASNLPNHGFYLDYIKIIEHTFNESEVTTITKDTVTTAYVKTLGLVVGDHIQMGADAVISWDKVTDKTTVINGINTAQLTAYTGVSNAATAQKTANTGVSNAATAQSTANSANTLAGIAKTNAGNAQTTANTGVSNAATAQKTANTGVSNAATAQSTANSANTLAGIAKTNAGNAQTTANTGVSNAATAQKTANTGVDNAATAQSTANSAKSTAESKTDTWVTQITRNSITAEYMRTLNLEVGNQIQMSTASKIEWEESTPNKIVYAKNRPFNTSSAEYVNDVDSTGGVAWHCYRGWTGKLNRLTYWNNIKRGTTYKIYIRCRKIGELDAGGIQMGFYQSGVSSYNFNITSKVTDSYKVIDAGTFTPSWNSDANPYLWFLLSNSFLLSDGSNGSGLYVDYVKIIEYIPNSDDITTITKNTITTTNLVAQNLQVQAANISGQLTASQINFDNAVGENVTLSGNITATTGLVGGFTIIDNKLNSTGDKIVLQGDGSAYIEKLNTKYGTEFYYKDFDFPEEDSTVHIEPYNRNVTCRLSNVFMGSSLDSYNKIMIIDDDDKMVQGSTMFIHFTLHNSPKPDMRTIVVGPTLTIKDSASNIIAMPIIEKDTTYEINTYPTPANNYVYREYVVAVIQLMYVKIYTEGVWKGKWEHISTSKTYTDYNYNL